MLENSAFTDSASAKPCFSVCLYFVWFVSLLNSAICPESLPGVPYSESEDTLIRKCDGVYRMKRTVELTTRLKHANRFVKSSTRNGNVIILRRCNVGILVLILVFAAISERSGTHFPGNRWCEVLCSTQYYIRRHQHP